MSDNIRLLDMNQLADFVGRHPQVMRKHFSEGTLPEPRHRIKFGVKTTRRFTLEEARQIKVIIDNAHWGDFAAKRRRLIGRQKRMLS